MLQKKYTFGTMLVVRRWRWWLVPPAVSAPRMMRRNSIKFELVLELAAKFCIAIVDKRFLTIANVNIVAHI